MRRTRRTIRRILKTDHHSYRNHAEQQPNSSPPHPNKPNESKHPHHYCRTIAVRFATLALSPILITARVRWPIDCWRRPRRSPPVIWKHNCWTIWIWSENEVLPSNCKRPGCSTRRGMVKFSTLRKYAMRHLPHTSLVASI